MKTKKDLILEKNKNTSLLITAAVMLIIVTGAIIFFTKSRATESKNIPRVEASDISFSQNEETRQYPASLFDDRKARYFTYNHNDITVKYFVLKSSDNIIRAAFDACDVCWREGRGYEQVDNDMICRNCGRRFESTMINEVKGGCNPAPLTRTITDNTVTIKISDIIQGARYFDFEGRI